VGPELRRGLGWSKGSHWPDPVARTSPTLAQRACHGHAGPTAAESEQRSGASKECGLRRTHGAFPGAARLTPVKGSEERRRRRRFGEQMQWWAEELAEEPAGKGKRMGKRRNESQGG